MVDLYQQFGSTTALPSQWPPEFGRSHTCRLYAFAQCLADTLLLKYEIVVPAATLVFQMETSGLAWEATSDVLEYVEPECISEDMSNLLDDLARVADVLEVDHGPGSAQLDTRSVARLRSLGADRLARLGVIEVRARRTLRYFGPRELQGRSPRVAGSR